MCGKRLIRPAVWWGAFLAVGLPGAARAELHFPQPIVSVGEVRGGVPLSQRFDFVNQGPEGVEITGARASCGCLTPRFPQRLYQPGEQGSLLLEVNTLSQPEGSHTWQVELSYRSGSQLSQVPLQIVGRVVREVLVEPPALTVFADRAVRHEVLVTDRRSRPLTITEVQAGSPRLKTCVAEVYRNGAGHAVRRISLEVADDYPEGRHDDVLAIFTDDPDYRELRVPVTVVRRSRQRLSVTPSAVRLEAASGQPVPSQVVLMRDSEDQPVVVERVESDDPAIVCQWAAGPNRLAAVRVRVERSRMQGNSLSGEVRIHVSQPVPAVVTVPVKCLVR